ncbi:MAG: glycosyltransferase family 4 protein [Planctomycetaceae bacterium]
MPTSPPRPRHCMVVYAIYPLGETRVQREAEALVEAGYDVDVLCLRGPGEPARERYRDVEVHRLPYGLDKRSLAHQLWSYVRFTAAAGRRLARLHRARPYASVQAHNLPDFLVFSALPTKLRGVPVILDLHDLMPEFFAGRFGGKGRAAAWIGRLVRLQERVSCAFADHVITVSEHWRRTLIARGVPPAKVSVVMNVADERIFVPPATPRPNAGAHLIYHGTVTRRYGLDLAIEAVALLREDLPDLHLTVIGRGDDMERLEALRDRLGVAGRVTLRDELVIADELPALLAEADVGLAPYRNDVFTDGLLPTKLMEYAVMGMPCIAGRTTAIESEFADTFVAFFTPGDAEDLARRIRELHDDPALRDELAAGTRRFTERANWKEIGARYVELVERLGSRRAPSSITGYQRS